MSRVPSTPELAKKVVEQLGGTTKCAEELETTKQVISSWLKRGLPPIWERYLRCSRPELFDS